jgi:myo-inositol-1(or 4)-monophosphatase
VPRARHALSPASDITVEFAARILEIVRRVAADEIMPRYRSIAARRKDDGSLVTDADIESQRALAHHLHAIDNVPVLGEEMPRADQLHILENAPRYWCVDPVDGTSNFAHGIPYFGVSVALVEEGRPLFGTVYAPVPDEAFFAVQGAGAWLNQRPLRLAADAPPLARAHVEVSLRRDTKPLVNAVKKHRPYARRRTIGSATLAWCDLAAGRIDAMLHGSQKIWDYAAGALILAEAGGALSTVEHDDFWRAPPFSRSVIAARNGALRDELRDWVRSHSA